MPSLSSPRSPPGSVPGNVTAQIDDSRIVLHFLKALNMSSRVEMSLTENGVKLSVRDDAKTFQANAFLQKELFRHLTFANFDDDGGDDGANNELVFGLDTASIIDCLSMFGQSGQTVLCLKYVEGGGNLQMWLEESGVIVEIVARAKEPDDAVAVGDENFGFDKSDLRARVIMISEYLKEVFNELDLSSDTISLSLTDAAISIATSGNSGDVSLEIPAHSEIVSLFTFTAADPATSAAANSIAAVKYRTSFLKQALRPLAISDKVSLRVDSSDTLCLQYMVSVGENKSFLEFYCRPVDQ